ncbi:TonB family protein [Povalibacter uvarum]|uniref:TonB family protein n=1 Tax=Povalibacter uvarum TaxID=732238 RepID=A0A841HND6_9GAMM|nr:energy transducer TonB [Povalibacter uvarum]MBB6093859.1 TonB family protein [Povalibacter uvarum]
MSTRVASGAIAVLLAGVTGAQTTPPALAPEPSAKADASVPVEVFKAPLRKRVDAPAYPLGERKQGRDGWVNLNFMIDPQGKPYEIMVTDSTGNKALEQAAVEAARDWEFEPATLDGVPIDAGQNMKVNFVLTGESGANSAFVSAYKKFVAATKANDRAKADAALARMRVQNLYEDAFFNLAQFEYARQWGTKPQQLAAIKRAIAEERNADYLPKSAFLAGLEILLGLQIDTNDFAGAMNTYDKLRNLAEPQTLAKYENLIGQITNLRSESSPYAVTGDFGDSTSWYFLLFRKRFQINLASGRIAEIKLRCDKRYVFFKYDPEVMYTIADKYGSCSMELVGEPGTQFKLIQS